MTLRRSIPRKFLQEGAVALLLLAPVLALASYLRLANLAGNPGWYSDEGTLINIAQNLMAGRLQYLSLGGSLLLSAQQPLFFWQLSIAFRIWGVDIGVLRALTGVIGVVTVFLGYVVVNRLSRDRFLAWLAALVLAIYPMAVLYSRLGSSYNLLALFGVVFLWGCGEYLAVPRPGWLALATLAVGFGLLVELLAFVWIPVLAIVILVRRPRHLAWCLPLAVFPLLVYIGASLWINPQAVLYDLHYLTWRVNEVPLLAQIPLVFVNFAAMIEWDPWVILGVVGFFCLRPLRLRRLALLAFLVPLVLVARTVGLAGTAYYYAVPFLPLVALGLAGLLRWGVPLLVNGFRQDLDQLLVLWGWSGKPQVEKAFIPGEPLDVHEPDNAVPQRRWGLILNGLRRQGIALATMALLLLLVVGPLLFTIGKITAPVISGYQTSIDWALIDPVGARQAAAFINRSVKPTDLVVTSPAMAWLVQSHVADYQLAVAVDGGATVHYPVAIPANRFVCPSSSHQARYCLLYQS